MMEIRWHGRAGQGAKLASTLLAQALMDAGNWVQAFPEYGPERSGQPVQAYTRFDTVPIRRRTAVVHPDVVVVLDGSLLTEVDVVAGLGGDKLLVLNTEEPEASLRQRLGFGGRLLRVAGDRAAAAAGGRHANTVLLGALARALGKPALETLRQAVREALGGKGAGPVLDAALAALDAGYAAGGDPSAESPPSAPGRPRHRAVLALKRYQELRPGAIVCAGEAPRLRTGGWRSAGKPQVDLARCVNCLLCWVYCPDVAIALEATHLLGFDYDLCKGCELCAEICPTGAIAMVAEDTPLPAYGRIGG